jgi:fluoroquinolone resistance protein
VDKLITDQHFSGNFFQDEKPQAAIYENCVFEQCNFNGQHLSGFSFVDCRFEQCDLSNAQLGNTAFREVSFQHCKMLGLRFDHCSKLLFSGNFETCQLDFTSFYGVDLRSSAFTNCRLHEADFTIAKLNGIIVKECDLAGTVFENTDLRKSDFRNSYAFNIDPEINKIHKARFTTSELGGLLGKYQIIID